MGESKSVTAIVTKAEDFGENDRLVRLFAMEGGMLRAKMRGVKKPKAKLKFAAQPFAFCRFELYEKGGYYTVASAVQIESLFEVTYDAQTYAAGCLMLETADIAVDEIPNPDLFVKLLKALKSLICDNADPRIVAAKYILAALHAQGYGARYDGISDTEKLTEGIRLTPLASLGSLAHTDETANGALRRAAYDFEYHFDRQLLSLKSCISKGERT